jgi:hypothetical protein
VIVGERLGEVAAVASIHVGSCGSCDGEELVLRFA